QPASISRLGERGVLRFVSFVDGKRTRGRLGFVSAHAFFPDRHDGHHRGRVFLWRRLLEHHVNFVAFLFLCPVLPAYGHLLPLCSSAQSEVDRVGNCRVPSFPVCLSNHGVSRCLS